MDKKTIRNMMKEKLNAISKSDITKYSKNITNTIKDLDVFKNADRVFLFSSIKFEPKTQELINLCLSLGKKVYLPTIVFNEMYPVKIEKDTKYYTGKFNIKEPFGDIHFGEIDLTIMPMTAFDKNLNRVGKGGGYYDKYLGINPDTYKLGIGYSFMEVDEVDSEETDIILDAVVTEEGIKYANN